MSFPSLGKRERDSAVSEQWNSSANPEGAERLSPRCREAVNRSPHPDFFF